MVCLGEFGGSLKTKNALNQHLAMIEGMKINNDLSFENMGGYYDYHLFAQDVFINELNRWAKKLEAKQGNTSVKETIDIPPERKSTPLSLTRMAQYWGGDITAKKIRSMINSGTLKVIELNRQSFIFETKLLPEHVIKKLKK